jgi:hypothetical protein
MRSRTLSVELTAVTKETTHLRWTLSGEPGPSRPPIECFVGQCAGARVTTIGQNSNRSAGCAPSSPDPRPERATDRAPPGNPRLASLPRCGQVRFGLRPGGLGTPPGPASKPPPRGPFCERGCNHRTPPPKSGKSPLHCRVTAAENPQILRRAQNRATLAERITPFLNTGEHPRT